MIVAKVEESPHLKLPFENVAINFRYNAVILTLMVSEYRLTDSTVDARELTCARTWIAFI